CRATSAARTARRYCSRSTSRQSFPGRASGSPEIRGLSKQGHAITGKIEEVDELMRENPRRARWLLEVHPEVTFRYLAEKDLTAAKAPSCRLRSGLDRIAPRTPPHTLAWRLAGVS